MYAIIVDGGRQYRVEEGQQLDVDYRDLAKGAELTFDRVLAIADDGGLRVGQPVVDGARVTAEVLGVRMGEKLSVQKLRRRKNYRRRTGHRQMYTTVQIRRIGSA
jgi:large subunit ribosomal protein L21